MSWITLTPEAVKSQLSAVEIAALANYLAPGQSDPTPDLVARTASEVRGYVAAHYGTQVGVSGTIPEELESAAVSLARWRLLGRLATGKVAQVLMTDARRKDYEDAVQQLRDVAAGKFAVSVPDLPSTDQPRPQGGGAFGKLNIAGSTPETFNL
jgi:phage gp36-like protein